MCRGRIGFSLFALSFAYDRRWTYRFPIEHGFDGDPNWTAELMHLARQINAFIQIQIHTAQTEQFCRFSVSSLTVSCICKWLARFAWRRSRLRLNIDAQQCQCERCARLSYAVNRDNVCCDISKDPISMIVASAVFDGFQPFDAGRQLMLLPHLRTALSRLLTLRVSGRSACNAFVLWARCLLCFSSITCGNTIIINHQVIKRYASNNKKKNCHNAHRLYANWVVKAMPIACSIACCVSLGQPCTTDKQKACIFDSRFPLGSCFGLRWHFKSLKYSNNRRKHEIHFDYHSIRPDHLVGSIDSRTDVKAMSMMNNRRKKQLHLVCSISDRIGFCFWFSCSRSCRILYIQWRRRISLCVCGDDRSVYVGRAQVRCVRRKTERTRRRERGRRVKKETTNTINKSIRKIGDALR